MAVSTAAASAATAVDALLKWKNTQSNSGNPQLLPQDDFIYLILTLKKIPQKGGINGARTNPNKIPLPHPLIAPNSFSEICLIIDDRPNSKLTSEIAKKKIKSDLIPVSKVIKLSKLKTDYKPFEAKRKLCDSYEMFFADKRVIPLLPKLLGKQFFKKKKLPLPVDLTHKNWKEQIERGCSSALLFFRTGTCCVIRVAKVSMEKDEIVENVNAAIDGAVEFVPKKLSGVRSLHLKFSESVALPLYQALPEIRLKIEGIKGKEIEVVKDEDEDEDEVMEIDQVVKNKKKKLKKGRIHEVNHDEMVKDYSGSDEVKVTKKKDEVGKKKKSKNGKINEIENDQEQEIAENLDEVTPEKKKRKESVIEENDLNTKPVGKKAKKKQNGDSGKDDSGSDEVKVTKKKDEAGKKKKSKNGTINDIENDQEQEIGEILDEVKPAKKKRKESVIEENGLNTKPVDKKAKKKQNGDSGKKEKKKGRSVSRV